MMIKKKMLVVYVAAMAFLFACGAGPLNSGSLQAGLDKPTGLVTIDHLTTVFHRFWRQVEHPFLNGGIIVIPTPTANAPGSTNAIPSIFDLALHKFTPKISSSSNGKPGALQLLSLPTSCLANGMFEKGGTVEIDLKCAANDKREASGKMFIDADGLNPLHIKADAIVEGHFKVVFHQACLGGLCINGELHIELKKTATETELLATYDIVNSYDSVYLRSYVLRHHKDRVQAKFTEEVQLKGGIRTKFNHKGEKSIEFLARFKNEDLSTKFKNGAAHEVSLALKIQFDAKQNTTRTTLKGKNGTLLCSLHKDGQGVSCEAPASGPYDAITWSNSFGQIERSGRGLCLLYCP